MSNRHNLIQKGDKMDENILKDLIDKLYEKAEFNLDWKEDPPDDEFTISEYSIHAECLEIFDIIIIEVIMNIPSNKCKTTYYIYNPQNKNLREVSEVEFNLLDDWCDIGNHWAVLRDDFGANTVSLMTKKATGIIYNEAYKK